MEPATYLVHRFVMHGPGWTWHGSHHRRPVGRFERNDRFPIVFASTTIAGMALGARVRRLRWLLPVGAGVTSYGMAYALVHDGWIHDRFPTPRAPRPAERLAAAHRLHHRFGAEPYGMLVPVVPRSLVAARDRPSSHSTSGGE
jgi:beta-carotene 3-hydroxylase